MESRAAMVGTVSDHPISSPPEASVSFSLFEGFLQSFESMVPILILVFLRIS